MKVYNKKNMPYPKLQVVYKLEGIDAEDGVDVFEIAPILMHFGDLVRSANSVLGYDQKIDVKIKPVRAGSWIADFVFQQTQITHLLNYLHTPEGTNLALLMAFLGLSPKDGIVGIVEVIRFTKGFVNKFTKNSEKETVTYESPTGEKMEISTAEHRLIQSPLIQNNYYNCVISPFDKFPTTTGVSFENIDDSNQKQIFLKDDKPFFEEYARTELLEDVEESTSMLSGVFVKPKRGSYSGEEKQYSFIMGENNVLWPVTIDDESFIEKLRSGELRLYAEDVLKVDLEVRQKKDVTNKILTSYAITEVSEYMKYEKPKQLGMHDMIEKNDNET